MRRLWTLIPLGIGALLVVTITVAYQFYLPKVKSWLLVELEHQSQIHSPFRVWPQQIDLQFFPPGVRAKDVRIIPQKELKGTIEPFKVDSALVDINWLSLMKGRLRIAHIMLDGFQLSVNAKSKTPKKKVKKKSLKQQWSELDAFTILETLPIDQIEVKNLDLEIVGVSQTKRINASQLSILAFNDIDRVELAVQSPKLSVTTPSDEELDIGADIRLAASSSELEVLKLKVTHLTSYLLANGYFTGDISNLNFERQNFDSRIFVDLFDVQRTLKQLAKAGVMDPIDLPELRGQTRFEIKTDSELNRKAPFEINAEANNLKIGPSLLEQIFVRATYQDKEVKVSEATFDLSAGKGLIRDAKLSLDGNMPFEATASLDNLELNQFLTQIGVGSIPVRSPISANLPCKGQIKPKLRVSCDGQAEISRLQVWSDQALTNTIVKIGKARFTGKVNVTDQQVDYQSTIQINDSTGSSNGVISYKDGFNINYEGRINDVSRDIQDLVGLDLNGAVEIKGKTFGTTQYGRIQLFAKAEDLVFESYDLGKADFDLVYKSGFLYLNNIKGARDTSLYQGAFNIDLRRSLIDLSMNSPYLDLKDFKQVVSNKVAIPFPLEGTGAARVTLRAPLSLKTFDLSVKSSFYRGLFAAESFDQMVVNIVGKGTRLQTQKVQLRKANSLVELKGSLTSKGKIDAAVIGNKIRLEQSDWLNSFGLNLSGQLDFTSSLRGSLNDPTVEVFGRLTQMTLADEPAADSRFRLNFDKSKISGDGNFVGKTLITEFSIPYSDKLPFRFLLKANNWDFTHFFNAFSGVSQKGYSTGLTGTIDLKSPSNWLWRASGQADVTSFFARKGDKEMSSKKPMKLIFNKGVVRSENIRVDGSNGFVNLDVKPSSRKQADLKLNGKFDMTFLTLLTPFLDDLRGVMSLSLNLKTRNDSIELLGSSYIQDGYIRLRGLPHAFENVTGDLLITHTNILINSLTGQFASGQMSASGKVSFPGEGKIPISILSQFTNISPNIPEGFKTNGNANLYFRGDSPPYTLGGDYIVNNGEIKTNLSEQANGQGRIKPSEFLPKVLTGDDFEPVVLDLNVSLLRPLAVDVNVSGSSVKTNVSGNIRVTDPPTSPRLAGTIKSEPGGSILFRSNTFDIRSAFIEYKQDPPENPLLNITAVSEVVPDSSDSANDLYEVTMDIRGRAKKPIINLSSQPQLSESDIISLLALGVTSSAFDQNTDNSQQVVQKGLEVGSQFLTEQLGINKTFQETTGFEVRISSDEENPTVPKLTVRRQFTPKFGVSVGGTSDNSSGDVKLEYKFNRNWSVIGQYETKVGSESTTDTTDDKVDTNKLGLDLEYKVEFR